jgi:hypothetical protein
MRRRHALWFETPACGGLLAGGLTAIAGVIALGTMAVTALLFARLGRERACELGLTAGLRNRGLMVAAAADAVPEFTWLYFAAAVPDLPAAPCPEGLRAARVARPGAS